MSNPFTNTMRLSAHAFLLSLLVWGLAACATQTATNEDGSLSTSERLSRIKQTGSSKEPTDTQEQTEEDATEQADDVQTEEEPETPVIDSPQSETSNLEPIASNYRLPKAIKRTHPQVEVSREARSEYKAALKALEKGVKSSDFTEALGMLESLVATYPELSGPQTNIGMIYMHQEKYEDAEKAFLKALEINPENEFALNNLGLCYRELGKFQEAKQSYLKATALEPGYAEAHYNLGVLAELYLQDLELAIQSFEYYRLASRGRDQEVDTWLTDLRNRLQIERQYQAQLAASKEQTTETDQTANEQAPVETQAETTTSSPTDADADADADAAKQSEPETPEQTTENQAPPQEASE